MRPHSAQLNTGRGLGRASPGEKAFSKAHVVDVKDKNIKKINSDNERLDQTEKGVGVKRRVLHSDTPVDHTIAKEDNTQRRPPRPPHVRTATTGLKTPIATAVI